MGSSRPGEPLATVRAINTGLSAGLLDCRGRRDAHRHRLVESLGWCNFRHIDDRPSCRSRRPDHALDNRGLPHRGADAPGTTTAAFCSRLPPGPALHGIERDAGCASRDGAQSLVCRGRPAIHPVDCRAENRPAAPLGCDRLILVAMDGCNWLAHLANHRVGVLWRFHELHHSQEDMSVLTVFRTHPLVHVSYLLALIPGIVLLANGAVPTTLLVVYAAILAFEHSNTNLGFGRLERILVSPNYHRIHHKFDGPQDVNLGFALTIWDQLSHRAIFPTRGDDQD